MSANLLQCLHEDLKRGEFDGERFYTVTLPETPATGRYGATWGDYVESFRGRLGDRLSETEFEIGEVDLKERGQTVDGWLQDILHAVEGFEAVRDEPSELSQWNAEFEADIGHSLALWRGEL